MPSYTFESKSSGEQKTESMTIADMEQYIIDNPDWFVVIAPLGVRDNFVASRFTQIPQDTDFRSMLDNMKRANPGSTIQT